MISRQDFYSNNAILFEILKQHMNGRETAFIMYVEEDGKLKATPPIRWLMSNYLDMLKRHWQRYLFLDKSMNIYFSLTRYNLPNFSYNMRIKSAEQMIWMQEFKNRVIDSDCFIETDSDDLRLSLLDSKDIRDFFNKYCVRYSCKFSGSKGFHFIIPAEEFGFDGIKAFDDKLEQSVDDYKKLMLNLPCPINEIGNVMDKVMLYKVISIRLKTILGLATIDTGVLDVKRICKSAYSWDVKSNHIAYPLTNTQLDSFDKSLYTPDKVVTYDNYKRGLLFRHEDVSSLIRRQKLLQMISDLGIVKLK